jgi:uncharacterized protein YbjT (DUF2867 family)
VRCLVTGATGYIGSRLVPRLLADGYAVRCLTRSAGRLRDVPWAGQVEITEGDLTDPPSVAAALAGIDVAYYLVHSMGQRGFEATDRTAAITFAAAARAARLRRIVYLGGPEPRGRAHASAHLRSRAEVARILLRSGVPAVALRAAVIIGSGSASFEMLRYLTERLPAMVTPRWVHNPVQPIAIGDVLRYLVACAGLPPEVNRGFDIGGPEVLSYGEMMRRYAVLTGLRRRLILPVRPLTPRLSSYWVGLVTPVPAGIAKPLVASLVHEAVAREHDIERYAPDPPGGLTRFDDAVRQALAHVGRPGRGEPGRPPALPLPTDPPWSGGSVYTEVRHRPVAAPPEVLWQAVESMGGERGLRPARLAWAVRGWVDRLAGGVGPRRGRDDPRRLRPGDAVDFWRVERVIPGRLVRLRAETRLPGQAYLEMGVVPRGESGSRYLQRVVFLPHGLAGHAYWVVVRPFHRLAFGGMARGIAAAAERNAAAKRAVTAGWSATGP